MKEREQAAVRRWLAGIAANALDNAIGRATDPAPDRTVSPDAREWVDALPHLEELPQNHREVLALRLRDGMDYPDIAARLHLPLGTVHSRIARARQAVRRR